MEFLNLVSAVAGYQVSQPYMSVFNEEDEATGNGGGHSITYALHNILQVAKFRQSRRNITANYIAVN